MSEKYLGWSKNPKILNLLKCAQMDTLDSEQQLLFEKAVELANNTETVGRWNRIRRTDPVLKPVEDLAKTMEGINRVGTLGRPVIVRTTVFNIMEVLKYGKTITFEREKRLTVSWEYD